MRQRGGDSAEGSNAAGRPNTPVDARVIDRKRKAHLLDQICTKIQALLWVIGAALLIAYTDFIKAVAFDERTNRGFIGLGYAALAVGFTVYMYLVVYLPYIARIDLAWEVYCPNMIPTATLAGVTAFFSFTAGIWPIYGAFSLLIVGAISMGALMALHFIPKC